MLVHYPKYKVPATEMPSHSWLNGFVNRNDLKKMKETNLEKNRIQMGTTSNVKSWFDDTYSKIDLSKYDERMIGNADESMLQSNYRLVCIVKRTTRFAITSEDENSEHCTILTVCTVNGDYMPPLLIFPLKSVPKELDKMIRDGRIIFSTQESGWIDKSTFSDWCKKFVKWIEDRRKAFSLPEDCPFLLFLDSHSSRESSETLQYLKDHHVHVTTYPSHCSHLLQPLDVSVFGPFKKYFKIWRHHFNNVEISTESDLTVSKKAVQRAKTCLACINALHQAMVYTNIENGFRKTGLFPRDSSQCLKNPRICKNDTITMTINRRGHLPATGGIITSESIINHLKSAETRAKNGKKNSRKRKSKNADPVPNKKPKKIAKSGETVASVLFQPVSHANTPIQPVPMEQFFAMFQFFQTIQANSTNENTNKKPE